jgi:hypothetical protein
MASKSKHTGFGIAFGAALGALAGLLLGHPAIWLGSGIAIGMVLGVALRGREARCPECDAAHRQHQARAEKANNLELSAKG